MSEMAWQIENFDDAIEFIAEQIGSNFLKALNIAQDIIDNPHSYTGPQASMAAMKLGAHRTKIGVASEYWKLKAVQSKKPVDRLIKGALCNINDGLLEMINCLKAQARHEKEMILNG